MGKIDFDIFGRLFSMGMDRKEIAYIFNCEESDIDNWCIKNIGESFEELCIEAEYAKHINQDKNKPYTVYMHIAPNGKKYIGITKCTLNKRWGRNGSGYISNKHFSNAINKYGWGNIQHAILYMRLTKEEAEQKEIDLIKRFKTNDRQYGYNIEGGGSLNKEVSNETREKLRKRAAGKRASAATREKMRESHSGERCHFFGVPNTEEHKKKLSKLKSKPVLQIDDNGNIIQKYDSISIAAQNFGVTRQAIYSSLSGKRKKSAGYCWKFEE